MWGLYVAQSMPYFYTLGSRTAASRVWVLGGPQNLVIPWWPILWSRSPVRTGQEQKGYPYQNGLTGLPRLLGATYSFSLQAFLRQLQQRSRSRCGHPVMNPKTLVDVKTLKGLPYHDFGVYVQTIKLLGFFWDLQRWTCTPTVTWVLSLKAHV